MLKRFNLLDLLICAGIIVMILAAIAYLGGGSPIMASDKAEVYFTVEFVSLLPGFHEKISIGDTIEDSAKGYYYGVVSNIKAEPTIIETLDAVNQRVVKAEVPNRETILLTVKCVGTESDILITAGGQPIKIGQKMTLKGKGYAMSGFILEIRTYKGGAV